jgi:hypothetical protein
LYVGNHIFHNGDTNTSIEFFQEDGVRLIAGGFARLNITTSDVVINENSQNLDFRVESQTSSHLLFTDASANRVGINQSTPAYTLDVTGTGYFSSNLTTAGDFTETSSLKYKENILPYSVNINRFDDLKPVKYTRKSDGEQDLGFIAEEMHELMPEFVGYKDGEPDSIKYSKMVTMLVGALQETRKEMQSIRNEMQELKSEIEELKKQNSWIDKIKGFFKK